jgi:hypothetical protein
MNAWEHNRRGRQRLAEPRYVLALLALLAGAGCDSQPPIQGVSTKAQGASAGAGAKSDSSAKAGSGAAKPKPSGGSDSAGSSGSTRAKDAGVGDPTTSDEPAAAGSGSKGSVSDAGAQDPGSSAAAGSGSASAGTSGQTPANTVAACVGHAGTNVCDKTTLYQCGDMGNATGHESCTTLPRCQAGTTTGVCGMCDPGEYRCTAEALEKCDMTGAWQMADMCASPELCMAGLAKHSCDPMKCGAGSFSCMGGLLRKCKDDLTDYDEGVACDMELCDDKLGKCYDCKPGSDAICSTSGASTETCSDDGKKTTTACATSAPYCMMGKCVACMSDSDCKSTNECQPSKCDTTKGMCSTGMAAVHAACSSAVGGSGHCDYTGNCLACVDDSDCTASQQCNPVLGCTDRPPLQLTPALIAGVVTVTVAPGYKVDAKTSGPTPSSIVILGGASGFGTVCTIPTGGTSCSGTIPSTSAAQTLTINGPNGKLCPTLGSVDTGNSISFSFESDSMGNCADATAVSVTLTASK